MIRDEFEKACEKEFGIPYHSEKLLHAWANDAALFGAKWMAERCAKELDAINHMDIDPGYAADVVLKLSSELSCENPK